MADEKLLRLVEAAKMYYQLDYGQQEIAKRLGISRPTVSRLLVQAKQEGIVQIKIFNPTEDVEQIARQVKEKFQLKHCVVTPVASFEDPLIKEKLGGAAADYLYKIVESGDTIGITWGTTIYQLVKKMQPKNVKDVTIVQLNGGVSYSESNTYAAEIVNGLANAFNTTPHFLPVPAIVDSNVVKEAIVADRHVKKTLELGKKANIAIYTVGEPDVQSTLMQAGYFFDKDIEILRKNKTVGDVCSRFINQEGQICNETLNDRTIGIQLSDLAEKEYGILLAGGASKIDGIYGTLTGGYANILITDQYTARSLLEMESDDQE